MTGERLALDGGTPVRTRPFPAWPQADGTERDNLLRALDQAGWWRADGHEVVEFEREFAEHEGAAAAVAVTNGTHALEVALLALGVGRGDQVVVPAHTFISTASAVQRIGAVAVPVDVDGETWCLSAERFAEAVTPATRAVVPVHLSGAVADLDAITAVAARHGIAVVQDAAQAHGATWGGRPLGALSPVATYSFQNGKLVSGGEGGAVVFCDGTLVADAMRLHNCGRPLGPGYEHRGLGSNYRMNEFTAAVLRAQLGRLDGLAGRRERNARRLESLLDGVAGIRYQRTDPRCTRHARYMFLFEVDAHRDRFVDALVAEGIPASRSYPSIHATDMFHAGQPLVPAAPPAPPCGVADRLSAQGIWLHHRLLLDDTGIDDIAGAIRKVGDALEPVVRNASAPRRSSARAVRPHRCAVVGLGWAAERIWLPRLSRDPRFEVVALVDRDDAAVDRVRHLAPDAPRSTTGGLSELDVDLAIVATPNADHAATCVSALDQGLDVFVEKPLCLSTAQFREIAEAAARSGRRVVTSSATRFRHDVRELFATVEARCGRVGSVRLSWIRRRGIPAPGTWYTSTRAGGGVLFDLGSHLLDLGLQLLGPAEILSGTAVLARGRPADWHDAAASWRGPVGTSDRGAADAELGAHGLLALSGDRSVGLDVRWSSHNAVDQVRIEVDGDGARVELCTTFGFSPSRVDRPTITCRADGEVSQRELPVAAVGEEYDLQLAALADVREGRDSLAAVDPHESLRVVQGLELLHASAAPGRRRD